MSERLDGALDAVRLAACAENDTKREAWERQLAAGIAAAHPLTSIAPIRARGNHLAAQNDERELDVFPELVALSSLETARLRETRLEAARVAADLARNVNKGPTLAARNDRAALEAQVLNLDAMRRAGW